jgi:hypothetical protein
MPARSPRETQSPSFIFRGTVQKAGSATMKAIKVDNRTLVVTVDQVIEAPTSLAKFDGNQITVQLSGNQQAAPGQSKIFHCNGWIFGDSVAVQCVKLEEAGRTRAALLTRGGDPVEHRRSQVVNKRFAEADAVVSGTVAAVKLPGQPSTRAATMRAAVGAADEPIVTGPISEHNPHWREAVISIDETHKGAGKREMVIRFPASTDVRWYKAPKFTPGQRGYFMLHKTKVSKRKKIKRTAIGGLAMHLGAAAATPEAEVVYTALHPEDYQPYSEPGGIKEIVDTGSDTEG